MRCTRYQICRRSAAASTCCWPLGRLWESHCFCVPLLLLLLLLLLCRRRRRLLLGLLLPPPPPSAAGAAVAAAAAVCCWGCSCCRRRRRRRLPLGLLLLLTVLLLLLLLLLIWRYRAIQSAATRSLYHTTVGLRRTRIHIYERSSYCIFAPTVVMPAAVYQVWCRWMTAARIVP